MTEKFFLDTNVLLYAVDARAPAKRARAQCWLERLGALESGSLSWQVLHAFYANATRKMQLGTDAARGMVEECMLWNPVDTSAELLRRAWFWMDTGRIAYWDALIVAAAEIAGARFLLSEDFQHGRQFGALRVLDPFGPEGGDVLAKLS